MKVMLNTKTGMQHIPGGCRWVRNCINKTHKPIPAEDFTEADYRRGRPVCSRKGCLAEGLG